MHVGLFFYSSLAMATHSSTLAWKIPWTEEPGRLQSMGSRRVGHDWVTSLSLSCIGEGNGNPLQCSCLENPRDGGPGGLPSMGSRRVEHDWSDLAAAAADYLWTSLVAQMVKRLPTMRETQVRSPVWEDPMEKEMATYSCTLAWKIPWMEEPGRLQSMGSQKVSND